MCCIPPLGNALLMAARIRMKKDKLPKKRKIKKAWLVRFIRRGRKRMRIAFRRYLASRCTRKRLLNIYEVSVLLNVPVPTLYRWVHEKRLPTVKLAKNSLHFAPEEIERWIESKKVKESEYWRE